MARLNTAVATSAWNRWRHDDGTPCEGPERWAERLDHFLCGHREGHGVFIAEHSRKVDRGFYHCHRGCLARLRGPIPRGWLVDSWRESERTDPWRACPRCAHDGGWRLGLPNAQRGGWPSEPCCRPVGRDDWLYAATLGSTVRSSGLAPAAIREIGVKGAQALRTRLSRPQWGAASEFLYPRTRRDQPWSAFFSTRG